jgi:hypothetical protein
LGPNLPREEVGFRGLLLGLPVFPSFSRSSNSSRLPWYISAPFVLESGRILKYDLPKRGYTLLTPESFHAAIIKFLDWFVLICAKYLAIMKVPSSTTGLRLAGRRVSQNGIT